MSNNNQLICSVRKDVFLMIPLILLNLVSGYTTIKGADLVLGHLGVAVIAGISIQGILFILLSGYAAKHAPVRKWLAVLVFSFFSIYTSFFAYHNTFVANDTRADAAAIVANSSHRKFEDEIATPFINDYRRIESQYNNLNNKIEREQDGLGLSGQVGIGPETRKLMNQRDALETQLLQIKSAALEVEKGLASFNDLLPGDPDAVHELDTSIWLNIPEAYRQNVPTGYEGPDRDEYSNPTDRYELLAPILTLIDSNPESNREISVAALVIAGVIDGVSIVLGTAIDKKKKRAPFEEMAFFLSQTLWGAKKAKKTFLYYWEKPSYRYLAVKDAETTIASDAVYLVELKLNKRGSEFLSNFLNAVDPISKKIDYARLCAEPEPTLRIGFRLLLEAFRDPSLSWVSTSKDGQQWMFSNRESYAEFCRWLSDEIIYQAQQEGTVGVDYGQAFSSKVVKFRRPIAV
jgi:hypothetical protein